MTPEILSQNEIDSLLEALSSGNLDVEALGHTEEKKIKKYDFRRPDKFSKDQLRAIQMIHEAFARQLTTTEPKAGDDIDEVRWFNLVPGLIEQVEPEHRAMVEIVRKKVG